MDDGLDEVADRAVECVIAQKPMEAGLARWSSIDTPCSRTKLSCR